MAQEGENILNVQEPPKKPIYVETKPLFVETKPLFVETKPKEEEFEDTSGLGAFLHNQPHAPVISGEEEFENLIDAVKGKSMTDGYDIALQRLTDFLSKKKYASTHNTKPEAIDREVRRKMMEIENDFKTLDVEKSCPEEPVEVCDLITRDMWIYEKGQLYRTKDGVKETYEDAFIKSVQLGNNCFSTAVFKGQAQEKNCGQFMKDCLLSGDAKSLQECIQFLSSHNATFADAAQEEINKMHPTVALTILKRFGFRCINEYDEIAGMDLKKVESIHSWKKRTLKLDQKGGNRAIFDEAIKDKGTRKFLIDNEGLIKYFTLLVCFVNKNPAILNKGYNGQTVEAVGKFIVGKDEEPSLLGLRERKDPRHDREYMDLRQLSNTFRSGFYGVTARSGLRFPTGFAAVPSGFSSSAVPVLGLSSNVGGIYGGGQVGGGPRLCGSKLLERYLLHFENVLKRHNKSIKPTDLAAMKGKLATMGQIELELTKSLRYIEEYARFLNKYGDNKTQVLSKNALEEMVAAQRNLGRRYVSEEQALTNIFIELQKLNRNIAAQ